jgi:uncharacterized protein YndB with AHSA1/START domain
MRHATDPATRREALPHVIRTVLDIAAPPARVFEALTDPRELTQWWGGERAHVRDCTADARPGGAWRVRTVDRDGTERCVSGEYHTVDAPRRLEQSWRADDDAGSSTVRYDLEPREVNGTEGTRLTVTHTSPVTMAVAASPAAWAPALGVLVARRRVRRRSATLSP